MPSVNLLYKTQIDITDRIHIVIPTVRDVLSHEDEYYSLVTMLTAMPYDLMVQLDDLGIDFTTIDEWDLFILFFRSIKGLSSLNLIFGDLDIENYDVAVNKDGEITIFNKVTGDEIDRYTYEYIAYTIRQIHHLEKNYRTTSEGTKRYLIDRMRKKQQRAAKKKSASELESLIVALVNTEQFKYDFSSVLDLTIYQFSASVEQIVRKLHYDNLMIGAYTGHIDMKSVNTADLNWLTTNK